jgi:hypothetical protein
MYVPQESTPPWGLKVGRVLGMVTKTNSSNSITRVLKEIEELCPEII